jgi:adenylate cyclase
MYSTDLLKNVCKGGACTLPSAQMGGFCLVHQPETEKTSQCKGSRLPALTEDQKLSSESIPVTSISNSSSSVTKPRSRRGSHQMVFTGDERKNGELQTFLQAIHDISAELEPLAVAEKIIERSCEVLTCDRVSLFYVDTDDLVLVVAKGAKNIHLPKTQGIAGHVATTGETVNIVDAHLDDRFDSSFDKQSGYRTKSVMATPVYDTDGHMIAVLQAINKGGQNNDKTFSQHDIMLFDNLAKHCSVALHNAQLYERTRSAEQKMSSLIEVVTMLHSQPNTNSLIFTLSHRSHQLVMADRSTLYLVDKPRHQLVVMQGDVDIRFGLDKGLAGHVATSGKVVNIPDCYLDERFNREIDRKSGYRTKSMLCMPIPGKAENSIVGVLQVINRLDDSGFSSGDEGLLRTLLKIAGPILEASNLFASAPKAMSEAHALIPNRSPNRSPTRTTTKYTFMSGITEGHAIVEEGEEEANADE